MERIVYLYGKKDIPSGVFATGNPCKVVKQIKFNKNVR